MLFLLIAMIIFLLIVVSILSVLYFRLKEENEELRERNEELDADRITQVQELMDDLDNADRLNRFLDKVVDERNFELDCAHSMLEMVIEETPELSHFGYVRADISLDQASITHEFAYEHPSKAGLLSTV